MEKVAPHGSGVKFTSQKTDWTAGPQTAHASSIVSTHLDTQETEEPYDDAFPDGPLQAGD